tara:strand:- start:666 stop:1691 length:1026 start_codon:yes stop_codon:yes gene_type:complete
LKRFLLVTGGAGFIGSNFVRYWVNKYPKDEIIVFDKLTYAGNLNNLSELIKNKKVIFVKGDILDSELLENTLRKYNISNLINFAAESHVDNSINKPSQFIQTNILGTFNLLNSFKSYWEVKNKPENFLFLQISTDEVFGSLGIYDLPFNEKTAYRPRSPYSASKAAGDHLSKAWFSTYGLPIIVSNCSNNYGPFHYPEKLIPLTITNILQNKPIKVYGDGQNIRDWLFVDDHCSALDRLITSGKIGSSYCIGGGNEITNINLVNMICEILDKKESDVKDFSSKDLITFVKDRPGHDLRYAIDYSYLKTELKWEPKIFLKNGLEKTINWYLNNKNWWIDLIK